MVSMEWHETGQILANRWPDWNPNQTEKADWQRVFAHRDQNLVREAAFTVRRKYASERPKMKWIEAELEKLERQAEADRHREQAENREFLDSKDLARMVEDLRVHGEEMLEYYPPWRVVFRNHSRLDEKGNRYNGNESKDPADWSPEKIQVIHGHLRKKWEREEQERREQQTQGTPSQ